MGVAGIRGHIPAAPESAGNTGCDSYQCWIHTEARRGPGGFRSHESSLSARFFAFAPAAPGTVKTGIGVGERGAEEG